MGRLKSASLHPRTHSSWTAFRWLISRYARRYLWVVLLVAGLTLVANLLMVIQPAILAALLANLAGPATEGIPSDASWLNLNFLGARVTAWLSSGKTPDTNQLLVLFGVLFVVQATLVAATNYMADYGAVWLRAQFAKLIQSDLLEHLLAQDIAFFTREKTGELISRATRDATNTAMALGPLIRSLIHHTVQIVVYSAYLFSTSLWLTLGSMVLLLMQFGFTQALKRPTRRLVRHETDTAADLLTALQESFTGIRVTKSFGAEAFELSRLKATINRVSAAVLRKSRVEKLEVPGRSVLDSLAVLGIFLIAILQMQAGQLTFQGLLLFTYVGKLLIAPINHMATNALWIETMGAAFGRISELLSIQPRVADGRVAKQAFEREIRFNDVSFAYGDRPALRNVTVEIRKGEFIALVGPSGAGKSTFTDLILRLYDPGEGEIIMDGVDLRMFRLAEYRSHFGVVSQETLLFNDTVRDNIRYGRGHLTEKDIHTAARIANAHDFIMSLPQQYDTVVGDRGIRLSGGERQRVAIARAVAHNPQILILDEATSALDSESERLVQQAIDQVVVHTTAIVIAHRLSTVMHADRIIVLNHGRIEAIGSNDLLLKTSPTYYKLHRLQFEQPTDLEVAEQPLA